jgi:hypothetical protein
VLDRLAAFPAESDRREMALISGVIAALAFAAMGVALGWSGPIIAMAALAMAVSTVVARSISRAVVCLLGAIALLSAVLFVLVQLDSGLPATLEVSWSLVAYAVWPVVILFATFVRRSEAGATYGVPELVAAIATCLLAIPLARRVDMSIDLIPYVLRYEDNAGWVGIVTQLLSADSPGPGFHGFGPLLPTLLGVLGAWQSDALPRYNVVFGAFMFLILLTPLVAAGLLRGMRNHGALVGGAFSIVLVLWALRLPFDLYATYGHLTAVLAFVLLLAVVGLAQERADSVWLFPLVAIVAFAVGAAWFPIIPLALIGLGILAVVAFRQLAGRSRVVGVALAGVAMLPLLLQLLMDTFGVGRGASASAVRETVTGLYAAQGGTASLDAVLQLAVLVGIAGVPFLPGMRDRAVQRPWVLILVGALYVFAVYGGSSYLRVSIGYGPTKLWFVIGWAAIVVLVSLPSRMTLPRRASVGVLVALALGSMFYGGAGAFTARSFYGTPDVPDWFAGAAIMASQERASSQPHALACFANDNFQTYRCTRWAASLSNAGDNGFINYRLQIVNGVDPAAEIARLRDEGSLKNSWLLLVDEPDADHPWAWDLIAEVERVYGRDGQVIESRPTPPLAS